MATLQTHSASQADYFLKLEGIKGESTDAKHKGEIEVESWSVGGTNPATFGSQGGGGGSGKVVLQDLHVVKRIDTASPNLFKACCSGQHIKSATLVCRKAGGDQQEFLTITLSDVLVSSFTGTGSADSNAVPQDAVSLAYSKIEWKYKEQKPDGSLGGDVIGGWDRKENKAF